jgi:hypothetical protein
MVLISFFNCPKAKFTTYLSLSVSPYSKCCYMCRYFSRIYCKVQLGVHRYLSQRVPFLGEFPNGTHRGKPQKTPKIPKRPPNLKIHGEIASFQPPADTPDIQWFIAIFDRFFSSQNHGILEPNF